MSDSVLLFNPTDDGTCLVRFRGRLIGYIAADFSWFFTMDKHRAWGESAKSIEHAKQDIILAFCDALEMPSIVRNKMAEAAA